MFSFLFSQAAKALTANLLPGSPISHLASGLGAYIGNDFEKYLLSDDKYTFSGYRFTGFNQQSFCYGADIPKVYGRVILSGNIVWYGEVREEKKTKVKEFGNIFKHKEHNTHYRYYVNFAMILCEGIVDEISRIWADEEEIYLNHYNLTIYYGTEEQNVDPLIASQVGKENVSAFRGLCYVVIKDFPIDPKRSTLPKFTFEVKRKMSRNRPMTRFTAINLGPGYGEFCYDPTIAYRKYYSKFEMGIIYHDHQDAINLNASNNRADMMVVLDHLFEQFPNTAWVTINIAWFVSSSNIGTATIYPTCEYRDGMYSAPNDWTVGRYNRHNARLAVTDHDGYFLYAGTPSDASIIRLVAELKRRKIKIMINPLLLVEDSNKTWRGNISGDDKHLDRFYNSNDGYAAFISHYANLLKDSIDGFSLGSEMVGLNRSSKGKNNLRQLARQIKNIFALRAIVLTYGADISEYDKLSDLWEDDAIDVIGVNAFFSKENVPNLNSLPTSKKIWFTQFGFPSIKNCEYEPKYSKDGNLNRDRIIDFDEQEGTLLKHYEAWSQNSRIEKIFLYYYAANPNMHLAEYGDKNWAFNHSLNFKSTNVGINQIIEDLFKDLPEKDCIVPDLYNQTFQGAIFKGIKNCQELLQTLSLTLGYSYYEKDGKLFITNKPSRVNNKLSEYENFTLSSHLIRKYSQVQKIRIHYISAQKDFNIDYVDHAEHSSGLELSLFFPFVVNENFALKIAQNVYVASEAYNKILIIKLPCQFYGDFDFAYYQIEALDYKLCSKKLLEDNILQLEFIEDNR